MNNLDLTYNWPLRNELETSAPGLPAANHVLCLHCRQQRTWDEFHVFDRESTGTRELCKAGSNFSNHGVNFIDNLVTEELCKAGSIISNLEVNSIEKLV